MQYYTYILTNRNNNVIYIGVTNNLSKRISQHKTPNQTRSFTVKYRVNKLVYFETFHNIKDAIRREKQLKNWRRKWKLDLIENLNPTYEDLSIP